MGHYKADVRDVEFNLFEVLNVSDYLGKPGPFESLDLETSRSMLHEMAKFSEGPWADSFVDADRTPLELDDDGNVTIPDSLAKSLMLLFEAGWHELPYSEQLGGVGAPPTIRWAAHEFMYGGNAAATLWATGPIMAMVLDQVATEEQKRRFVDPIVAHNWGGSMVLTEPDAGSDVGSGKANATHVEGDVWHLQGVKRFITSADAQIFDNVVHLVLARPEGAGPGTKGLSLFIVPKFLVNEDGSLGERNGVYVTNLEKKMGINGSATCELRFGERQPAVGHLVGDVHDGIRQMFMVIEYARMTIGVKAAATLAAGYANAIDYAKVRTQGADMTQMTDKTSPRVEIIKHPDVRRMLMSQKAHAEGMRALYLFAGWVQDQARLNPDDDAWIRREDLLLPMVKGYSSEKAYEQLALSLQTFGGSGYTQDYPIEQYIRDAKIDTLYEGTTAIQALDLFFRKIARDKGVTLSWLLDQVRSATETADELAPERAKLAAALADLEAQIETMVAAAMASMGDGPVEKIYEVGLHTNALLESLSEVTVGWLLLRHAEVALSKLEDGGADRDFYAGKVASARWFARNVLPKISTRRAVAEAEDGWLMTVPEAAF